MPIAQLILPLYVPFSIPLTPASDSPYQAPTHKLHQDLELLFVQQTAYGWDPIYTVFKPHWTPAGSYNLTWAPPDYLGEGG